MELFERRMLDKLERDLGTELVAVLQDPTTVELMLNPDGRLWLEQLGSEMRAIGELPPSRGQAVIKTLAGHLGKEVTAEQPLLEGELPIGGARFAGQLPPVVAGPAFSIRKAAVHRLDLTSYVAQGALTDGHRQILEEAVADRRNILVVGGTGSGKTTLVNALLAQMTAACPHERLVIIEDTAEIRCDADNIVQYRSSPQVSMTQLLRTTLRMRPDRILVGEVRGPEALDLLMAWNTGHEGGAATVHGNSAAAALLRLSMLVSMHRDAPRQIEPLIAETVDVIAFIARTPSGRRVQQVVEVTGHGASGFEINPL